jgi:hypothetical protein
VYDSHWCRGRRRRRGSHPYSYGSLKGCCSIVVFTRHKTPLYSGKEGSLNIFL